MYLVRSVDLKFHINIILKEFKNKPFVGISNLFHKTQNHMRYVGENRIAVVGVRENVYIYIQVRNTGVALHFMTIGTRRWRPYPPAAFTQGNISHFS
jgi:hypothetical protein